MRGLLCIFGCILGMVSAISCSSSAYATNLTLVGALELPGGLVTSNNGHQFFSHSYTYGGGGFLGFRMFPMTEARLGVLYVNRGFTESHTTFDSDREWTFSTIHIPLTFHYYVLPTIAIGLGGYYGYGLGSVSAKAVKDGTTTSVAYGSNSFASDDIGGVVSMSLKMDFLPLVKIYFDLRYIHGLRNISLDPSMSAYLRDAQILGGVTLGY